jgi:hypothetical protein
VALAWYNYKHPWWKACLPAQKSKEEHDDALDTEFVTLGDGVPLTVQQATGGFIWLLSYVPNGLHSAVAAYVQSRQYAIAGWDCCQRTWHACISVRCALSAGNAADGAVQVVVTTLDTTPPHQVRPLLPLPQVLLPPPLSLLTQSGHATATRYRSLRRTIADWVAGTRRSQRQRCRSRAG